MKIFILIGLETVDKQRLCNARLFRNHAFTLIELLVSMTVLTIIVLLMTQVFSGVASSTSGSSTRLQETSDVRNAMDRISFDIQAMVRDGNITPIFNSNVNGGYNDTIAFLSNVRAMNGSATNTRLAAICYSIETGKSDLSTSQAAIVGSQPMLTRWNKPYEWLSDSTGTQDLTAFSAIPASTGTATTTVQGTGTNVTYQVLNPDIFRMEIYFQLMDGTLSSTPGPSGGTVDWSIVQSIHMAFAVLDQSTRLKMTSAQILALCGGSGTPSFLSDFNAGTYTSASSTTPVKIWTQQIYASTPTTLPPVALKTLRFYERSYNVQ